MTTAAQEDRKVVFKTTAGRKVALKGFSLYERDNTMVDELAAFLGCSRSEAVRSAIRHFSAHLIPPS